MPTVDEKNGKQKKSLSRSSAKTKDIRVRMGRDDQAMLDELALAYGTTAAEAIRRAVVSDCERIREDRHATRLDRVREGVVTLQEQILALGRRVESSIALQEKTRGGLEERIEKVHNIAFNTWLNVSAMIDVSPKADDVKSRVSEILRQS